MIRRVQTNMIPKITLVALLFVMRASAQSPGALSNSVSTPRPFDPGQNTTNPSALAEQVQNPYLGSVPTGPLVPGVLPLSLHEAVSRALRANLGLIDSAQANTQARATRMKALALLLPQLSANSTQEFRNIDNAPIGIPGSVPAYNFQSAHVDLSQNLVDISANRQAAAAQKGVEASNAEFTDARNIVVLAATSSYLLVAASQVRLETARAQLATATAIDGLIYDRVVHEVSPQIEGIRARVIKRSAEQRVAVASATFEKDKLALTRIIGIPIAQEFILTNPLVYSPAPLESLDSLLSFVKDKRHDIQAAVARLGAATEVLKAERAERLPTLAIKANAGETGYNYARSILDYEVEARIAFPIFTGRRIEANVLGSQAILQRRQAELADIRERAIYDVRTASLDMQAAETSVEVAVDNVKLAKEGLRQAKDRFENGVTNSVDLVKAQQEVAEAEDNRIASVYSHSLAKLMLIRATGTAEANYLTYLGVN